MKVYSGAGLGSMYYELVRDITQHGRTIHTRYGPCLELPEPVTLEYTQPGHCWMTIPGRRWNPFLALAEIVWILTGNGNVEWISYYSAMMKSFQDGNDENFHGAYGLRMRRWLPLPTNKEVVVDQITEVIRKLKSEPDTRRAIISLWDPWLDNIITNSKDYPCNNWVGYTLRDGVLDQTVVIRSNDLVLGTPMNAVQFTHLHAYIAGCVGVRMGKLTYVVNNLHYYLDLYKPALATLIERAFGTEILEAKKLRSFSTFDDDELQECRRVLGTDKSLEKQLVTRFEGLRTFCYLQQVSRALTIFKHIKEKTLDAGMLAEKIHSLDSPLEELITDFYEPSSSTLAQEVVGILRRRDAVTT